MIRAAAIALLLLARPSQALFDSAHFQANLDLQSGGIWQLNPNGEYKNAFLPPAYFFNERKGHYYAKSQGYATDSSLRLVGKAMVGSAELRFNLHYQVSHSRDGVDPQYGAVQAAAHRSKLFTLKLGANSWSDRSGSSIGFDHLLLDWRPAESLALELGRMPINLASNFYISPNDLFAPFAPTDFLRLYKSGVDAARLAWLPAPLARFELIAAMGYGEPLIYHRDDSVNPIGEPAWTLNSQRRAALLGRSHFDLGTWAVSTLLGWKADRDLMGGSLERDLGHGMMAIFEGNISRFDDDPGATWHDISLGLQAQLSADWSLRAESASSPSFPVDPFPAALPRREQRSLLALGLDWQAGALVKVGILGLMDSGRNEGLASANSQVSVTDDIDLILNFQTPWRIPGHDFKSTSAFELAPLSAGLQIRWVI